VLVARSAGTLVGTVRSRREGDTVHVCRLAVDPGFRRRGIARRLLAELESRALAGKPAPARFALFTAEVDSGAVALYEGCGYRIIRTERPDAGPALVHMEKPATG
jgi:ribosomal protein S18 acetylase RimI-like enzyme